MDDSFRISKPPVPVIQATVSEDSSATIQEQKKTPAGIAETKDSFESKASDRLFSVDVAKGQVTFGDGIEGKVPESGNSKIQSKFQSGLGQAGNIPGKDQQSVRVETQRPDYFSGKLLTAADLSLEQQYLHDKRKLESSSADTLNNLDNAEELASSIKESIQDTNEDKKYFLDLIQQFNKMSSEIAGQSEAISDASQPLAEKEKKDDDDP